MNHRRLSSRPLWITRTVCGWNHRRIVNTICINEAKLSSFRISIKNVLRNKNIKNNYYLGWELCAHTEIMIYAKEFKIFKSIFSKKKNVKKYNFFNCPANKYLFNWELKLWLWRLLRCLLMQCVWTFNIWIRSKYVDIG